MPSGLTHILLAKKSRDKIKVDNLRAILSSGLYSFQVGAVAPDLPYASKVDSNIFFDNSELADHLHNLTTNQIPLQSLKKLKSLRGQIDKKLHCHMFSFFLGYISHVFADGIIHPFVRDKVGDYLKNQTAHRALEMKLDVLLFNEENKSSDQPTELNYAKLHHQIKNFLNVKGAKQILQVYSELIEANYEPCRVNKVRGWVKLLHRMFEMAEGTYPKIYRNSESNSFVYNFTDEINQKKVLILNKTVDNREHNFLKVDEIDFFKDCVPQYLSRFTEVAIKAHAYVFEEGQELDENDIPPINLDTGRLTDKDDLNLIPELWKNNVSI